MLNTRISRLTLTSSRVPVPEFGGVKSARSFLEEKFTVSFVPRGILILSSAEQPRDPKSRDSRHLQE